jgi:hypothetical protein
VFCQRQQLSDRGFRQSAQPQAIKVINEAVLVTQFHDRLQRCCALLVMARVTTNKQNIDLAILTSSRGANSGS